MSSTPSYPARPAAERFPFARAERLATYAARTFALEGAALLAHLCEWRDRDGVPLSDAALATIVAHYEPDLAELAR